jgi:hypothetical protein
MSPPSEVAADPLYDHVKPRFESGMEIDCAINMWEEGIEQPCNSGSSSRSESGEDSDEELVRPVFIHRLLARALTPGMF